MKLEGDRPNPYMASVVKGIASYDIANASRLTASMPMSRERGQAIDAMAKALLMSGKEVAFAFPDTIKDEFLKGGYILLISRNLPQQDPQGGSRLGGWAKRDAGAVRSRVAENDVPDNIRKRFSR